jgi:hypothetical protein
MRELLPGACCAEMDIKSEMTEQKGKSPMMKEQNDPVPDLCAGIIRMIIKSDSSYSDTGIVLGIVLTEFFFVYEVSDDDIQARMAELTDHVRRLVKELREAETATRQ